MGSGRSDRRPQYAAVHRLVEVSRRILTYYVTYLLAKMCGDMGKAVLRALTGALLCGLVSDAYLQVSYQKKFLTFYAILNYQTFKD